MSAADHAAALLQRLAAADDPSWYECLVLAGLDRAGGDLGRALELADAALEQHPHEPGAEKSRATRHAAGVGPSRYASDPVWESLFA